MCAAEEVWYRSRTHPAARRPKTLLSIIQATYPDEYENFKERIGVRRDDATILDEHWAELRVWTSVTQSLSRCVRGICYGTALRSSRVSKATTNYIEKLVHDIWYRVRCTEEC